MQKIIFLLFCFLAEKSLANDRFSVSIILDCNNPYIFNASLNSLSKEMVNVFNANLPSALPVCNQNFVDIEMYFFEKGKKKIIPPSFCLMDHLNIPLEITGNNSHNYQAELKKYVL